MQRRNRIDQRFEEVLQRGEKVLVGLIPFGDPNLEVSEKLADVYIEAGADIVEFALPSDDPFVDSQQIKDSGARALSSEPDILKYLEVIKRIRAKYPDEPFEVMAYSDALKKAGLKDFVDGLAAADVDAHLLADSIYQEPAMIEELDQLLKEADIYRIRFMPHPFRDDLLPDVGENGRGFMILQSLTDPDGSRPTVKPGNKDLVERVRQTGTQASIILAYGIRDPQRTKEAVQTGADGIIVGTSFVEYIGDEDYDGLRQQIRSIKEALS